eukprot:gnl/TRDRNA2_/TRDRNA2_174372_c1_seq12.p1 gnl/TRDRNA2_/TRDRNA2_174372_c1~~gnl/TRDRNA2_/TRDRNA2_174372_c1_seq12.p1  ORF type:complete len:356 (-),score=16.23 gnl/TRDRNA2_/TRDRNA2_174372_c1_seq12:78-1145(-)
MCASGAALRRLAIVVIATEPTLAACQVATQRVSLSKIKDLLPEILTKKPIVITNLGSDLDVAPCSDKDWLEDLAEGPLKGQMAKRRRPTGNRHSWAGFSDDQDSDSKAVGVMLNHFVRMKKRDKFMAFKWWSEMRIGRFSEELRKYVRSLLRVLGVKDLQSESVRTNESSYPGLYFATNGTTSGVHTDSDNAAFISFMCLGRKRWRIILPRELQRISLYELPRWEPEGTEEWEWEKVIYGLPNLHNSTAVLEKVPDLEYYEAEVGPGELLYVPQGTAHCAESIGHSLMVVHNHIDSSPCNAQVALELWEQNCHSFPARMQALFGRPDGKGGLEFCRRYMEWLKRQSALCPKRNEL